MSDGKYFSDIKRGELADLKTALHSEHLDRRTNAMKRVVAGITRGGDMSSLLPDVLSCVQTDNLELKKLVYLYLTANAHEQPDEAIMAVNTLIKDCADRRPLVRALAVRTLGSIRVNALAEHLAASLQQCLKDEDPYVRKTAVLCVAKLNYVDPTLVQNMGFVDTVRDLLSDANPCVLTNTLVALTDLEPSGSLGLNVLTAGRLQCALGECNEWGQVFILEALSRYQPSQEWEVRSMAERVAVHLAHANAAVVLTAVRILLRLLSLLPPEVESTKALLAKLSPPLTTLLSSEPEIQYVTLRNISLIIQKYPTILRKDIRVFFVKYSDPIYVKLEKLEILVQLAASNNMRVVLSELKQYATEVDVDFVRKAIRAIGRCAIKIENTCEQCVVTLLELVKTKIDYVVQEAIVVFRDIFRRYPNRFESVAAKLFDDVDELDDAEARAALIWMLGEYAERIDDADDMLQQFVECFAEESSEVQLTLLTAVVKLFLKRPTYTTTLVQQTLQLTVESGNPDLRDRGYIYWRLLSTDPEAARDIVLSEKHPISGEVFGLQANLLDELVRQVGTVASVLHKPSESFVDSRL